ncbi:MAG: peptidase G2 autoproteolytic cleavage domain-containing protein, partial [bacterium]|nr:peptidase G2 autoproteolytic cleavage domain-containing protein [bacterium]
KDNFNALNSFLLRTYKDRLLYEKGLSPLSINRKLSSLRSYFKFASKYGLINQEISFSNPVLPSEQEQVHLGQEEYEAEIEKDTSYQVQAHDPEIMVTGPLRLMMRSKRLGYFLIDVVVITPLAELVLICQKIAWKASGGHIFFAASKKQLRRTKLDSLIVDNFGKSFYAPLSLSFENLPLYKRVYLTLRHKRPQWYKTYHTYAFTHYAHFGILGICVVLMGSILYHRIAPRFEPQVLGSNILASGRQLQFKGQLLDQNGNPIAGQTPIRFGIYDDSIASGSSLLWQDVQDVNPDRGGSFMVNLGERTPIPNDIFSSGQNIYLGITIDKGDELKPRQPIPNVHLAQDAKRLSGLLPTTDDAAGGQNVVLALDSAGNLTIGHNASPIFQATNGTLTLRAQSLLFSSLPKSNGNITLAPDGTGIVDIIKPIRNTSENGSTPETLGAVEVADALAVLATESGRTAFTINQNGSGGIISASGSGIAKFGVDNTGSGYFAGNVTLDGTDLSTNRIAVNLFNRNAQIINLGGQAIAVTIGSASGTTTIRTPSTNLQGNLTISGNTGTIYSGENSGISFSGSGNHILKAESGVLQIGSQLELSKDISFLPATSDGINDLGSSNKPFDTIYVNNIVSTAINGQPLYWTGHDGILQASNITNDIVVGGNATASAAWQVFGSGQNKGTASSSGNLTFTGTSTQVNQLNGGNLTFTTSPGGANGITPQLTISGKGIGVGTTTPLFKLDVQDTRSGTAAAMITNLDTGANSSALDLKLGGTTAGSSFLRFLNGNGEIIGSIQENGSNVFYNGGYYFSSGSDFAEYFLKHETNEAFAPGNIVCLHKDGGVTKCSTSETSIIGVVSDKPSFIGNSSRQHDDSYILVGIQGQVPVLVSDENGAVKASDSLTFSSTPGVAAKAIGPSPIVGQALEGATDPKSRINTYINPSWYDPHPHIISQNGYLQFTLQKSQETSNTTYVLRDIDNNLLDKIGAFSDAMIGNLAVGIISAKEFVAEQVRVNGDLIAKFIRVDRLFAAESIISPLARIDQLQAHIISPLSDKDGLSLVFEKEKIAIIDPVSSKAAFVVDRLGNASLSGTLATTNLEVNDDATISGTLRVKKLIADEIESGNTSSPGATFITNITNIYESSGSAILTPTPSPQTQLAEATDTETTTPQSSSLLADTLQTGFEDISSYSSSFAPLGNSHFAFATITSGLMVFGPASFSDLSASGQLAVGGNLIIADASINVLGRDLELQSLRQGNLSVMGGLLTIDTQGNLVAQGNATFAKNVSVDGTLTTSLIAPIPDSDLIIQLHTPSSSTDDDTVRNPAFKVANATGSAIFRVNTLGDVIASGSGTFLKLMTENLNLVRGAQADTSVTQTVASSSAGTATINKGQKERTINSPFVSERSLIYLTPTSDTYGVTPYIARQIPQDPQLDTKGSFTIEITRPVGGDINLNWWIIN